MKLADYLQMQRLTPLEFSKQIGVKGSATVHRYIRGERQPEDAIIERIEAATGGWVSRYDFRPEGNVHLAGQCPEASIPCNDNDEFPWSRSEQYARNRVSRDFKRMMRQPPEWRRLSPPLRNAVDTLGPRVRMDRGQRHFWLDGRPAGAQDLVRAANRVLHERRQPVIAYPGVLRLDDRQ